MGVGWESAGSWLGVGWKSAGSRLGVSWESAGSRLGVSWESAGSQLGVSWDFMKSGHQKQRPGLTELLTSKKKYSMTSIKSFHELSKSSTTFLIYTSVYLKSHHQLYHEQSKKLSMSSPKALQKLFIFSYFIYVSIHHIFVYLSP